MVKRVGGGCVDTLFIFPLLSRSRIRSHREEFSTLSKERLRDQAILSAAAVTYTGDESESHKTKALLCLSQSHTHKKWMMEIYRDFFILQVEKNSLISDRFLKVEFDWKTRKPLFLHSLLKDCINIVSFFFFWSGPGRDDYKGRYRPT